MGSDAPGQIDIVALGDSAAEAVVWRLRGELRVTVVVKACFELEADASMRMLDPEEILHADVHHGRNPSRSVWLTSDLVPYLPKADVLLTGHACAPTGQTCAGMSVRLAVYGDGPLFDRSINVHGDRVKGAIVPFDRMPLVYERAFGGIGFADNPFGTGANDGARPPNLIDPLDPKRVACFGPIGRSWPARRKLLKGADARELGEPVAEIPNGFDFSYFQSAPVDQQIGYLVGNEWVVLEGVHPVKAQIASSLPSAIGRARVFGLGPGPGRALALVADTLRIDGDMLTCQVVWRGSFAVPGPTWLEKLSILAGVETAEKPLDWPTAPLSTRTPAPISVSTPPASAPGIAAPVHAPAVAPVHVARASVAPQAIAAPEPVPVAPAQAAAPAAPARDRDSWDRTVDISFEAQGPVAVGPAVPFREGQAQLPPPAPRRARRHDLATTVIVEEQTDRTPSLPFPQARPHTPATHAPAPTPFAPLPSQAPSPSYAPSPSTPPPPPSAPSSREFEPASARVSAPERAEAPRRPRTAEGIELLNDTPLAFGALPWGHEPSRDCFTVIAKATCDLVPGGPATLRPAAEPLRDDLLLEGARAPVCLHPSDLARFKTRADVTLVGHAHAPPGGATSMKVRFRLGEAPRGFDRTLLVFGARRWDRAGALSKASDPEPFLRIPLRYDHAFGGRGHVENPAGLGFTGKMGRPGPLPHLEDPGERVRTPKQAPAPACFAPIARVEKERRASADKVLRALADTIDWARHQAAPRSQQVPFLRGDEAFEIDGIHPQHPHFEGALPGVVVRCLAERPSGREEVTMHLDTAFFDLDEKTLTLVWRGLLPVSDEQWPDVLSLRLATVPVADRGAPIFDE